jgi:hypothetical protein
MHVAHNLQSALIRSVNCEKSNATLPSDLLTFPRLWKLQSALTHLKAKIANRK